MEICNSFSYGVSTRALNRTVRGRTIRKLQSMMPGLKRRLRYPMDSEPISNNQPDNQAGGIPTRTSTIRQRLRSMTSLTEPTPR